MTIIATPRLSLREFKSEDASALRAVFGDPEVMRFGSGPQPDSYIEHFLERMQHHYATRGFALWAVVPNESPIPVGFCGLALWPDINGREEVEVGYRLSRSWWGRGVATEAAGAVKKYAFEELELSRLISLIDPDNHRSIRVAEKIGMQHSDDVVLPGYTHADRVYSCSAVPSEGSD